MNLKAINYIKGDFIMVNEKRTIKQIERNFKVIRKAAKTATSMKEL